MRSFDVELEELRGYPWRELDEMLAPLTGFRELQVSLQCTNGTVGGDEWKMKCTTVVVEELKPRLPQLDGEGKFYLMRQDGEQRERL